MKKIVFSLLFISVISFAYTLKVIANVPGVSFYVNSKLIGITDEMGQITYEGTGTLRIQATKQGYWPREFSEELTLNFDREIHIYFYPISKAFINTDPEGADVFIEYGKSLTYLGKTPFYGEVPIGEHILVIQKEDYPLYKHKVKIKGEIQKITIKIPSYGYCNVETTPPASVIVDGVDRGLSPVGFKVGVGKHVFEFYKEGLLLERHVFEITSEPTTIKLNLRDIAEVDFQSYPSGALMSINEKIYELPVRLKIVEGDYNVKVWLPGFQPIERRIHVYKEMKRLTFKLEEKKYRLLLGFHGEVEIDGKNIGRTPTAVYVKEGVHILKFCSRFGTWYKMICVTGDSTVTVDTRKGSLVLPDVGKVLVNGVEVVTPAILNLDPGSYTVDLLGTKEKVNIESGKVYIIPSGFGVLTVTSLPDGLDFSLNGKKLLTPIYLYPVLPGEKEVTFEKGCAIWKKNVTITEGAISFLRLELPLYNIVKVTDIRNCEIIVDGERVEEVASLNIGFHLLHLKCGDKIVLTPFCYTGNVRDLPFPLGGELR